VRESGVGREGIGEEKTRERDGGSVFLATEKSTKQANHRGTTVPHHTERSETMERRLYEQPFTPENCTGYSQAEMDALNAEFVRRWNGWTVPDSQQFIYHGGPSDGELMTEADAIKTFQNEVARR
jgi:hypothetical protein